MLITKHIPQYSTVVPVEKEEQVSSPEHQREGSNGSCFCCYPAGLCIWHLALALCMAFITEIKEGAETFGIVLVEKLLEPCCFYVAGTEHKHYVFLLISSRARFAIEWSGGWHVCVANKNIPKVRAEGLAMSFSHSLSTDLFAIVSIS